MRPLVLLIFCAGCTGGFLTAGGAVLQPDLDNSSISSGAAFYGGGGVNIPVDWRYSNPLHGKHGIPHPEDVRPNKLQWEFWGGYSNANDQDRYRVGTGIRIKLWKPRLFYARLGGFYQDHETLPNAWGAYATWGYDFYLTDDHRWSIAPEATIFFFDQDLPGGGSDNIKSGQVGIFLTYMWKHMRKE